ncbi:YdcF family protein [Aurantiacibacter sp. D1-12]|uniref:YdcF family protein n=1 Tax=Aurantiacibacter sp. D1-12 TaxID=2993658 RepID=UPI00237CEFCC|nr:YdcF family protein [Aurantiacibacter sp. D1-12]MDE1466868.1 YdcF family protein [Aurantiacibacter sp. D1-12]
MKKLRRAILPALVGWLGAIAYWIGAGPPESPSASADVAIVLGAAVDSSEPSPVFRERISHGITLFNEGRVERLIFTGGRSEEDALAESEVARDMALAEGLPEEAILIETESGTTMHNLVEAQLLMRDAGLDSALIVSDPLHMRRATEMADALGMQVQASATPTTRYRSFWPKAQFLAREVYFMHHFWLFGE